jgi:hypothetical protein
MISGVTDWGNFSLAFRSFGADKTLAGFKDFIKSLGDDYFAGKINSSLSYMAHSKELSGNCKRLSSKILPALKAAFDAEKPKVIVDEVVIEKPKPIKRLSKSVIYDTESGELTTE